MAMNHLHLAVFLCSSSEEHHWFCARWTENVCSPNHVRVVALHRSKGGRDGAQTQGLPALEPSKTL